MRKDYMKHMSLGQLPKLICADYKTVLKAYAQHDDFIFLDPPYDPISTNSDFNRYNKIFFMPPIIWTAGWI